MAKLSDGSILRHDVELFIVSILILYLELVPIRWIGTEIRIFAYLGNLILVICFFGVGLGCYLSQRPVSPWRMGLNIFLLAALVANPLYWERLDLKRITYLLGSFEDYNIWQVGPQLKLAYVLVGLSVLTSLTWIGILYLCPSGSYWVNASRSTHDRFVRIL